MSSSYRARQFKQIAASLNLQYSETDTKGLLELVKDCSLPPKFPRMKNASVRHILSQAEVFEGRTVKVFDYMNESQMAPVCTMMMIRSMEFDFPFTSIQPRLDHFPPKQPRLKRRRKQHIERIQLRGNTHYVYTADPEYWNAIDRYVEPLLAANPELFLELNNFFLFYSEKYRKLPSTKVKAFYEDGLKLMNLLQMIRYN